MTGLGVIKVVASVGKGMTIVAHGHPARIVAIAAAIGVVTISVAIAVGTYLTIRSLRPALQRIPLRSSDHLHKLPA
jgi:hypothetical protein